MTTVFGLPALKKDFEPLVPCADDYEAFGRWAADQIEQAILLEGADTVAAVFLEPVQNTGGCFRLPARHDHHREGSHVRLTPRSVPSSSTSG